jgi:predicted choloylglycine hydrolase
MKRVNFVGSSYDVGRQIGEYCRGRYKNQQEPAVNRQTLARQTEVYQKYFPSLLDEIRGMAEAAGETYERVLYASIAYLYSLAERRRAPEKGCTIFGVKKPNGELLIGRNYDWWPLARDALHVCSMAIDQRYKHTIVSDMGVWGRREMLDYGMFSSEDAINEHGLYIGLTFAHNPRYDYGLSPTHVIRLVAETCRDVDEALKLFAKIPVMAAKNFFLADASGNMAVVEHTSREFEVIKPNADGVLIQTNHYTAPSLFSQDRVLQEHPAHTSYLRYYETLREISRHLDDFTLHEVERILRKSHYVYSSGKGAFGTIWSLALNMNARQYRLIYDTARAERKVKL